VNDERSDNVTRSTRAWVGGVGIAVIFLMAVTPYQSYDVWHHMRCGCYAWHNGPGGIEPFSCTGQKLQLPWLQHEWLSQIVLYLWHQLLGPSGTVLMKAAMLSLGFWLLAMACRARGAGWDVTAAAVALAGLAGAPRFFVRPEIFSFVLLGGLVWALEAAIAGRRRAAWLLPPGFALWANLHGAYVAGWAVIGLALVGVVVQQKVRWPRHEQPDDRLGLHLVLALAGCIVGVCVNPNGARLVGVALDLTHSPIVREGVEEWTAPDTGALFSVHALFIPLLALSCVVGWRRLRIADWLMVVCFTGLALSARRHIPILAFVTCPIVAEQVDSALRRMRHWPRLCVRARSLAAPIGCVAMLFLAQGLRLPGLGLGVGSRLYPVLAADFLESESLEGNLFNNYVDGNYLIWRCHPRNLVFIDGRIETYGEEVMRLYYETLNAMGPGETVARFGEQYESDGWSEILDRFEVEICLIPGSLGHGGDGGETREGRCEGHPLANALWAAKEWKLVFWDDERLVFVRGRQAKGRYAYRTLPGLAGAAADGSDELLEASLEDTAHRLSLGVRFECFLARARMADLLRRRGRFPEALPHLRRASELRPRDGSAAYNLGACLLSVGEAAEATGVFRRAIELGMPEQAKGWNGLANAALALGRNGPAASHARQALRLKPGYALAYLTLSAALEREGDIASAIEAAEKALALEPGNRAAIARVAGLKARGD